MQMANAALLPYQVHCPKNNLNFRIKAEPVSAGTNARIFDTETPDIFSSSAPNRDRLGVYAKNLDHFWDSVLAGTAAVAPTVTGSEVFAEIVTFFWDNTQSLNTYRTK